MYCWLSISPISALLKSEQGWNSPFDSVLLKSWCFLIVSLHSTNTCSMCLRYRFTYEVKIIVLTKDFFILILHIINITMKKTKLLLLVAASVLLINGKQSSHDSMTEYVGVWDFTAVVRTFEMVESIPLIDSLIIRWGFKRSIRWNNVNLHWPRDS